MNEPVKPGWRAVCLAAYLLILCVGAAFLIAINFPDQKHDDIVFQHDASGAQRFVPFGVISSTGQGLIALALLAGAAGSFLHAAQSLSSFVGNGTLKWSWGMWYFLRPWIGAILGFTLYFAFRTGLVAGINSVNPYGVVSIGLLGGWFSKTATDKLQEVFETLFKTDADRVRKDKLLASRPIVTAIVPSPVPANVGEFVIEGQNFLKGTTVLVGGTQLPTIVVSETRLRVSLANFNRPAAGTQLELVVKNPDGDDPHSRPARLLL